MIHIKIKNWIREKLIKFLLLDEMEERNSNEFKRLTKYTQREELERKADFQSIDKQLRNAQSDIETLHETIRNVVSVGVDMRPSNLNNEKSWAVVCIEGNFNVVKFIDLHGADYQEILRYLKRFEGSRMCVDAPGGHWFEQNFHWL